MDDVTAMVNGDVANVPSKATGVKPSSPFQIEGAHSQVRTCGDTDSSVCKRRSQRDSGSKY